MEKQDSKLDAITRTSSRVAWCQPPPPTTLAISSSHTSRRKRDKSAGLDTTLFPRKVRILSVLNPARHVLVLLQISTASSRHNLFGRNRALGAGLLQFGVDSIESSKCHTPRRRQRSRGSKIFLIPANTPAAGSHRTAFRAAVKGAPGELEASRLLAGLADRSISPCQVGSFSATTRLAPSARIWPFLSQSPYEDATSLVHQGVFSDSSIAAADPLSFSVIIATSPIAFRTYLSGNQMPQRRNLHCV